MTLTIYTAIYGGIDPLHQPLFHADGIRYVCFTDNPSLRAKGVETFVCRPHEQPQRAARWYKTHPPEGDSIWLDGSYQVIGDLRPVFASMTAPVGLVRHQERQCPYQEAIQCAARHKDRPMLILRQAMRYTEKGLPPGSGLWQGGIIMRRAKCRRDWQEAWWNEILNWSHRDQISLAYALWSSKQPIHEFAKRPDEALRLHKHPERLAKQLAKREKARLAMNGAKVRRKKKRKTK